VVLNVGWDGTTHGGDRAHRQRHAGRKRILAQRRKERRGRPRQRLIH
jgi:hypothetical protein